MMPRERRQALAWAERLKSDRSAETRAAFEAWLAADPAHRREYDQTTKLDALLAASARRAAPVPRPSRRAAWPAVATALACGAIVVVALGGLPFFGGVIGPGLIGVADAQLVRPVRLADGSLAILSAQAKAEPRFTPAARAVRLSGGSARFVIAHDARRPLVVVAGDVRASASEGVFDIDPASGGGRVTVVRGSVAVASATAPERARTVRDAERIDVATMAVSPAPPDPRVTLIEADGLSLGDVVRLANADPGLPLAIATPALAARRLTGRFDISDHGALARRLAAALGVRATAEAGQLLLSSP